MIAPRHDLSVEFLRWLRLEGPWTLTAIAVDRKAIETETFTDLDAARAWLGGHGQWNLYFSVNPLLRPMSKKPAKTDVAAMDWLYVDVDPRAGEDLAQEQARALELLTEKLPPGVPAPSCLIFSGGGYQGLWRLSDPIPLNGDEAKCEEAERYNRQLELLSGADHCHNCDRILRLPGTVNWADPKKRAKDRVDALATFTATDLKHEVKAFVPAPLTKPRGDAPGDPSSELCIDRAKLKPVDLAELPATVHRDLRPVIVQGCDPDDPGRWPSRSEVLFWVCCELVRGGVSGEAIYSIITDPSNGISASVRDYGANSERYAERQVERAMAEAIDPDLKELNEKYCVVGIGKTMCVVYEWDGMQIDGRKRSVPVPLTFEAFRQKLLNRLHSWKAGNETKSMPLAEWWLRHPHRRQREQLVFLPAKDRPEDLNLWRGFAVKAQPGSCDLFLAHVRENICNGDSASYDYLIRWMARAVQVPWEHGHVAIVLRGRMGTGKNVFVEAFGTLFGRHYVQVSDPEHIFGKFNAHMRDCSVLFPNEAFWAGNKKHEGQFKSLISDGLLMVEGKGVDAVQMPSFLHLIVASNEDWVIPAGADERRALVLDVSDAKIQDTEYFKAIRAELAAGGYEALLHMLQSLDLAGFEVRKRPVTAALNEQKAHSLGPLEQTFLEILQGGEVSRHVACLDVPSKGECRLQLKSEAFAEWVGRKTGRRISTVKLGQLMEKLRCEQLTNVRPRGWMLPALGEARAAWDLLMFPVKWRPSPGWEMREPAPEQAF